MRPGHSVGSLVFLVGPPGSGKSTLAGLLEAQHPSTAVLRAGDYWRHIAAGTSRFATEVRTALELHEPIPPRVFMLAHRLFFRKHRAARLVVVEGTPFSVEQIITILAAYRAHHYRAPVPLVAKLLVGDTECWRRMRARGRSDDTDTAIAHRLAVYHRQQEPAIGEAVRQGLLQTPLLLSPGSNWVAAVLTGVAPWP